MTHHFELPKLALLAGIAVSALVHGQTDVPTYGDVTFELVGNGGGPAGGTLEIYSVDGGKIIEQKVGHEATFRLTYGKHLVQYIPSGMAGVRRYVTVDSAKTFVVIPWRLEDFIYDGPPAEPGTIEISVPRAKSCVPGGSVWAKLVGVYSEYSAVIPLASEGTAEFESVDFGLYVVMILDAEHLRTMQAVNARYRVNKVNITLPDCESEEKNP